MKVVIAVRPWLLGVGLGHVVTTLEGGAEILMAADGGDLHRVLVDHSDVAFVLIDDAILSDNEEEHFVHVRTLAPKAAIGVLVGETDREQILKAIYFGAVAIIQKHADEAVVRGALRSLFDGQVAFPRDLLAEGPPRSAAPAAGRAEGFADEDNLTPREREVIDHVGTGKTVARIAADLKLSPHTVRVHVTRIMKKLDLRDRSALIHYAVKRSESDEPRRGARPYS